MNNLYLLFYIFIFILYIILCTKQSNKTMCVYTHTSTYTSIDICSGIHVTVKDYMRMMKNKKGHRNCWQGLFEVEVGVSQVSVG